MKTQFVLSAAAACLCAASCSTDPAIREKKKSVSVGRFGVTQIAAPVDAPATGDTSGTPAEKKSGGLFGWLNKEKTDGAPVAGAIDEKAVQKPAEVVKTGPAANVPAPVKPAADPGTDGIRLPNMLGSMPEEKDLKATNPSVPKSGEGGGVISRPPVEKAE